MGCEIFASHCCFSKGVRKYNNIHMPQSRTHSSKLFFFFFFVGGRKICRIQLCWVLSPKQAITAAVSAGAWCHLQQVSTLITYISTVTYFWWYENLDMTHKRTPTPGLCNRISKPPIFYTLYCSFRIVGAFSAIRNNPKRICSNCSCWTLLKMCT